MNATLRAGSLRRPSAPPEPADRATASAARRLRGALAQVAVPRWLLALGLAASWLGCERSEPPRAAAPPSAGDAPAAVASPSPKASALAPARAVGACRLMSLRGAGRTSSGRPLEATQLLGTDWIELGPDARAHVKHTETGREWTLQGPSRAWFCPQGREEIALGTGVLEAESGPGARPGAEVTVGTAFGSARYGDARARFVVSERELRVEASSGEVWFVPFAAPPAPAKRAGTTRRGPRDRVGFDAGVRLCKEASARAAALGTALIEGGPAGLGQRAAEHVRARRWARESCANAAAALLQQASGAELEALWQLDPTWQRVTAPG